jgi:hypothetical protein
MVVLKEFTNYKEAEASFFINMFLYRQQRNLQKMPVPSITQLV